MKKNDCYMCRKHEVGLGSIKTCGDSKKCFAKIPGQITLVKDKNVVIKKIIVLLLK